jgi:hypothetical protein
MEWTPALLELLETYKNTAIDSVVLKLRNQYDEATVKFIVGQLNGRRRANQKLPVWGRTEGLIYPSTLSFEQCSSEETALWKGQMAGKGACLVDITGGFGVDCFYMGQGFEQVHYIEAQATLVDYVQHNFKLLGARHTQLHTGDGLEWLAAWNGKADVLYLDPARRDDRKGKVFLLEDCTPNVVACQDLLRKKARRVLLKLSPMLDLKNVLRALKGVQQIAIVSVRNECKELLVELGEPAVELAKIPLVCVDLGYADGGNVTYKSTWEFRNSAVTIGVPRTYLYEPNKSLLKAGVQNKCAVDFALDKLGLQSNFFTSDHLHTDFPGRIFEFETLIKAKAKVVHKYLGGKKANIIARNYPINAKELYKRLQIIPGGTHYLIATQLEGQQKALFVAKRIQ